MYYQYKASKTSETVSSRKSHRREIPIWAVKGDEGQVLAYINLYVVYTAWWVKRCGQIKGNYYLLDSNFL